MIITPEERQKISKAEAMIQQWRDDDSDDANRYPQLYEEGVRRRQDVYDTILLRHYPLKKRIADVVASSADTLCGLTRHAFGCWVLNRSPLRHLWMWALFFGYDEVREALDAGK